MEVERSLRKLQGRVRHDGPPTPEAIRLSRVVPAELATKEIKTLFLSGDEVDQFESTKRAVINDRRFEHLKNADEEVWRFLCKSVIDRKADHVGDFVAVYARDPQDVTCFIPVEHLHVKEERRFAHVDFLPTNAPRVPPAELGFRLDPPTGCVAAVESSGTNYRRMAERAHEQAALALRILRIALREHRMIAPSQLRFRLATSYSFGEHLTGWRQPDDQGWDLGLNNELVELAVGEPVASLTPSPSNDLERNVHLAMVWMERASLASEPLPALLFLFFALEALLGDKSAGTKAEGLAVRQAMLNHDAVGSFTHPTHIFLLYAEVRSAAVHGEKAPDVTWNDVSRFAGQVRRTLNHVLLFSQKKSLTKRGQLLKALDTHEDLESLLNWLIEVDPTRWRSYCELRLTKLQ